MFGAFYSSPDYFSYTSPGREWNLSLFRDASLSVRLDDDGVGGITSQEDLERVNVLLERVGARIDGDPMGVLLLSLPVGVVRLGRHLRLVRTDVHDL